MADDKPTLHVDTDWKKQAQEEKRRQMEKERQTQQSAAPSGDGGTTPVASGTAQGPGSAAGRQRQIPAASFTSLVQSLVSQALYYLGDLAVQGRQGTVNLDMAKIQVDTLSILEEKTRNNLSDDEKRVLDTALYELRMRFVTVASQFLGP